MGAEAAAVTTPVMTDSASEGGTSSWTSVPAAPTSTQRGLLPLRFLSGAAVYRWSRLAWALLFGISVFAFVHLLVGPNTGYLADLSPAALIAALGAFAAFGAFSLLFWGYFRFRPERVSPGG